MFIQFTNITANAISGVPGNTQAWISMDAISNVDVNPTTGRLASVDFISADANPFGGITFTAPQPVVTAGTVTAINEAIGSAGNVIETDAAIVAGTANSRWWINGANIGPVVHISGNQLLRPDNSPILDLEGFTNAGGINLGSETTSANQVTGLNALTQAQRDGASIYGKDGSTWFVQRGPENQPSPGGPNSGLGRFTDPQDFRLFKVYIPSGSTTLTPITLGTNDDNTNTAGGALVVNAAFGAGTNNQSEGGNIFTALQTSGSALTPSPLRVELVSGPRGSAVLSNQ